MALRPSEMAELVAELIAEADDLEQHPGPDHIQEGSAIRLLRRAAAALAGE